MSYILADLQGKVKHAEEEKASLITVIRLLNNDHVPNDRVGYQNDANLTVDQEEQNQTREHLQPSLIYVDDDEFNHQETPHKANANEKLNQQREVSDKRRKDRSNDNAAHSVKPQEIHWEQKQDGDNKRNPTNNKETQKTKKNVQI